MKPHIPIFYLSTLFCLGIYCAALKTLPIAFNSTASMPIGFYKQLPSKTIHRGDIVAVCLPNFIAKEGLKRGYLIRGRCTNGTEPVLKKVIALPSDTVKLTDRAIIVNNKRYKAPHQKKDHHGKPIRQFAAYGIYHRTKNYWLYGTCSFLRSWDSRYYGGIGKKNIVGFYKLL